MRKKKPLPIIENVEIVDVAAEGKSIAKIDDMVVFIPYGAPGDIVDIKLDKKKKSFAEAHIERMVRPSEIRIEPFCEHFGVCGGCKWQHLPYDFQLKFKRQQVVDALQRIAKVEIPEIPTTIGSDNTTCYRNKLEYTFSNKSWLTFEQMKSGEEFPDRNAVGFHIPGAFDKVLNINKCWLQDNISNEIRLFIRDYALSKGYTFYDLKNQQGLMRTIMVRIASTCEIMLIVVFGEDNPEAVNDVMEAIKEKFPQITSLLYVINLKVNDTIGDQEVITYSGKPYIEEEMEGLKFRIGPKSFYQTNSHQAYKLYSKTREFAHLTGNELVYDLYTGTGTIANFVARQCRKVVGVEYVPEAIDDARLNSQVNGIDNTLFYAGDMKDILTDSFVAEHGVPDVMIIDPPRAGMHEDVVKVILNAAPKRIVYVSCNPATQARDVALLDCKYKITDIQPVDMFPHTHHVENIIAMDLR
ncbi:MAG: 23S rRNA (uracil(1939)-C(5))-methyltransferase RlmD [Bacteroidales bacterium]|nr:23S rRNA (uracil(1939)-C(5))-methyltransferase RlmD [Bacteroidales bacterium]MDD7405730.1 23S rRNA (uracil(1939)-C(5))-methyltransferase RlmD [Bacteroidales bacterium]MDY2932164.1 23S rRNA (uracil(1939)-C(5))-methyltransferase RlmD [Muribaculaceae bacterium]MDY4882089.1 23S rRNA (uracil(1939)-C(5))-methyltransferase RlmD [Muribaculaceae bacterium]MDY5118494.1 23S rRNA (uracil(1939)-C(5))-methyltransferase RlmD [Muribaculaceae bacterium]